MGVILCRPLEGLIDTALGQGCKDFDSFLQATRYIVKLADVLGRSSINTMRTYLLTTGAEHARQMDRLELLS